VGWQDGAHGRNLPEGIVGVEVGGLASDGVDLIEHQQVHRSVVAGAGKRGGLGLAEVFDHGQVLVEGQKLLFPEEQDLMFQQPGADCRRRLGGQRLGQVEAVDVGAQAPVRRVQAIMVIVPSRRVVREGRAARPSPLAPVAQRAAAEVSRPDRNRVPARSPVA
jgi:hypothetical protein